MKDALILTGQIRLNSEEQKLQWDQLKSEFKNYDVFICTYEKYLDKAKSITDNIVIFDEQSVNSAEYLKLPPSKVENDVNVRKGNNHMWQHIHLRKCMETFHQKLKNYNNIVKIRNDVKFRVCDVIDVIEKNPNSISLKTDWLFGCKSDLFLKMFYHNNFLDYIKKMWNTDGFYVSLNYKNLNNTFNSQSGRVFFRWDWFRYKNIKTAHLNLIKKEVEQNKIHAPSIDNFRIVPTASTTTGKLFDTAFASEKQIAMYFLFFAELAEIDANIIIR